MKIIEPISALIPWESYDYQGHIALYITLKKIDELLVVGESLESYNLQIEGEEDFSLLKDNTYISLHQVKVGKVALKDNDKFAFIIELIENDNAKGYFHINRSEKIPTDFCKRTLDHITLIRSELKKRVVSKSDFEKDTELSDYIVIEEIKKNSAKASTYKILDYVLEHEYDANHDIVVVKAAVQAIDEKLADYYDMIKSLIDDPKISDPDKEYLCVYSERFNTNREIRNEAIKIIIKILNDRKPEYSIFVNEEYAEFVYNRLFLFMKETITNYLEESVKSEKCLMEFDDIYELVLENYKENFNTEEYQYYQVLRAFADAYADYPQNVRTSCKELSCNDCDNSAACNLCEQMKKLFSYDDASKIKAIHNLIMFKPEKGKNNNLPSDSLISYLLCDVLKEVSKMKLTNSNVFQAIKNDIDIYRLTLDESRDQYEILKKLQNFISNEADKSLLYEAEVLITDRLDEKMLLFNEDRVTVLGERELAELRNNNVSSTSIDEIKKEYNRPKVIRLININTAIGELK